MKGRSVIVFFFTLTVFCLCLTDSYASTSLSSHDSLVSLKEVRTAFPSVISIEKSSKGVYKVYGKNKKVLGAVVVSTPYANGVKGFAGPTPVLIAIDKTLHVKSVKLLPNSDTPNFVEHVVESGLLNTWNGMTTKTAASKEVDAVTGATFTSTSVIRNVKAAISMAKIDLTEAPATNAVKKDSLKKADLSKVVKRDTETTVPDTMKEAGAVVDGVAVKSDNPNNTTEITNAIPARVWIKNIATVIVALLGMVLYFHPKSIKRWRIPLIILSIVVLGFWTKSVLSFSQFVSWIRQGIPLSVQWGLFVVAIFSIGLPLFFGKKYYCIYVCPFGGLQELFGKVNKRKMKMTQGLARVAIIIRRAILFALLLTIILFTAFDFSQYEPFTVFNFLMIPNMLPLATLVIVVVSLVLSIFMPKPWCRFVCPLGETLDLFLQLRNKKSAPLKEMQKKEKSEKRV